VSEGLERAVARLREWEPEFQPLGELREGFVDAYETVRIVVDAVVEELRAWGGEDNVGGRAANWLEREYDLRSGGTVSEGPWQEEPDQ
jgi:hypothetical protein